MSKNNGEISAGVGDKKEALQLRVTKSLRTMENDANELTAFLESMQDRRRTINITVGSGSEARRLQINTDELQADDGMVRFNSKGSLVSSSSTGRTSPAPVEDKPTRNLQETLFCKQRERRRFKRPKIRDGSPEPENKETDKKPQMDENTEEDVATRLRKRLDIGKLKAKFEKPASTTASVEVSRPKKTSKIAPVKRLPKPIPSIPETQNICFEPPVKQKELLSPASDEGNSDSGISYSNEININFSELDELEDLIISQSRDEHAPADHAQIDTGDLDMSEPADCVKPNMTFNTSPHSSDSGVTNRIDRILNSNHDELDSLDICPPPSSVKRRSVSQTSAIYKSKSHEKSKLSYKSYSMKSNISQEFSQSRNNKHDSHETGISQHEQDISESLAELKIDSESNNPDSESDTLIINSLNLDDDLDFQLHETQSSAISAGEQEADGKPQTHVAQTYVETISDSEPEMIQAVRVASVTEEAAFVEDETVVAPEAINPEEPAVVDAKHLSSLPALKEQILVETEPVSVASESGQLAADHVAVEHEPINIVTEPVHIVPEPVNIAPEPLNLAPEPVNSAADVEQVYCTFIPTERISITPQTVYPDPIQSESEQESEVVLEPEPTSVKLPKPDFSRYTEENIYNYNGKGSNTNMENGSKSFSEKSKPNLTISMPTEKADEMIKASDAHSPIPIPQGGLDSVKAMYQHSLETVSTPQKSPVPEVGSLQDRLVKYNSVPLINGEEEKVETQKVGKISTKMDSYLKQLESTSSAPSLSTGRTPSSGLRERMKAFQTNNNSNMLRRETVATTERASDIKNRIRGWGKADDGIDKKLDRQPGKINDLLNQYTKSAQNQQET